MYNMYSYRLALKCSSTLLRGCVYGCLLYLSAPSMMRLVALLLHGSRKKRARQYFDVCKHTDPYTYL